MKTFNTRPQGGDTDTRPEIPFQLEGDDFVYGLRPIKFAAYRALLTRVSELANLESDLEGHGGQRGTLTQIEQINHALDAPLEMVNALLTDPSKRRLQQRLDDPDDDFDLPDLITLLPLLIGEAAGRPTQSPSGSSAGRSTNGAI